MALTSEFLAAVRRQGAFPTSVSDADILGAGDMEVQAVFVPLLEAMQSDYLVREVTVSTLGSKVALPDRAVAATLRNVQLAVDNGWYSLPLRSMEDSDINYGSGLPQAYFLDAGSIRLVPTGANGTLRVRYSERPGRMVPNTSTALCAAITFVADGGANWVLTLGTYTGPAAFDVIAKGPAHQNKTPTSVTDDWPKGDYMEAPVIGDYVAAPGFTPFVPLPEELFASLVHRTAGALLRGLGYDEEAASQLRLAEDCIQRSKDMLAPRNEGNPKRVSGGLRRSLRAVNSGWRRG